MPSPAPGLASLFHPVVEGWFRTRFREATPVQGQAWPLIAEGRDVLMTAPTGSGKTTNLQYIYGRVPDDRRGRMVSLATQTEPAPATTLSSPVLARPVLASSAWEAW